MLKKTEGIHHITAIVGNPQENFDFYSGVLGLRMVKKTVNFDDPGTYHLYFGDDVGSPGTIITFFPWSGAKQGVIGDGQVGVTSYAIPSGALSFWEDRLIKHGIHFEKQERFGEMYLQFTDPHGLKLEIVEKDIDRKSNWEKRDITSEVAIRGFAGATLFSATPNKTASFLEEVMGLEKVASDGTYTRFTSDAAIGNVIDVKLTKGSTGEMGVGTVHHIAFRAIDKEDQQAWKTLIQEQKIPVTEVRDRNYFTSIYFKEYGNILFEIATDEPGFLIDESYETLGSELKLPKQYEKHREELEKILLPIHTE